MLLSSFETNKYTCSGSCYCENEFTERREATRTLLGGVGYLVAAVSSFYAFKSAKQYFENECVRSFKDTSCSNIQSEVEDCEHVMKLDSDEEIDRLIDKHYTKEVLDHMDTSFQKIVDKMEKRKFFCVGRCVPYDFPKDEILEDVAESFGCEKIELRSDFTTVVKPLELLDYGQTQISHVEFFWAIEILTPYCREKSAIESGSKEMKIISEISKTVEAEEEDFGLCVGLLEFDYLEYEDNDSVKCVEWDDYINNKSSEK